MEDSSEGERFAEIRKCCSIIDHGPPTRYLLKPDTDQTDDTNSYRTITYGERDSLVTDKVLKTLLLVGETGTGKTTLINTMINHLLKVQREDQIWFEITDEQNTRSEVHSKTPQLKVYRFYLPESPVHLNIIDTPGFGDTESEEKDKQIAVSLRNLSAIDICKVNSVCFVIKANNNRLTDREIYIFDAVQSLFGSDMENNIVLLLTFSNGNKPTEVLKAVKEAKVQCAVDEKDQPVYFLFDNCQSETIQENQAVQKLSWDLSVKGCTALLQYLNIKPRTLKITRLVLETREELEECIEKIRSIKEAKMFVTTNQSEELQELKEKKTKLVTEAFYCVKSLELIALNTDSLSSLQHLDLLIHNLKDIKEDDKADRLQRIKNRAGEEKHGALKYITR